MPFRLAFAILSFLLLMAGSLSAAPADPSEAFRLSAKRLSDGSVALSWDIARGHYLYRDRMSATLKGDGSVIPLETMKGVAKDDPNFGRTEVYYGFTEAVIAAKALRGPLTVAYQGCEENSVCYPPVEMDLDPATMALSSPAASGQAEAADGGGFVLADGEGLAEGLISTHGAALAVLSFFAFGVLLAFTPCVLPMYPIVAGILAREGESLSAARGFGLSATYAASLAAAFGLVGAAAGWSGENMQEFLHSPAVNVMAAAAFGLLALSMFGAFELQLPNAWTSLFQKTGEDGRGSYASAAVIGFSSALIVGPCVTAPLAASLLYVVKTGDAAFGAASLFALGLGKCAPLVAFATLGGKALPRSGQWMENVKSLFGYAMLGGAAWMAAPLLPPAAATALAGTILLFAGIHIAVHMRLTRSAAKTAAIALGSATAIYGTAVLAASASGGTDPMKPWTVFRYEAPEKPLSFTQVSGIAEAKAAVSAGEGPALVYFTADWCVECAVAERSVWRNPATAAALKGVRLVKADLSDYGPEGAALMKAMGVAGPPTAVFFGRDLREIGGTRIVGAPTLSALAASARTAVGTAR